MIKQLWGRAASLWYGNPSADFFVIGVTGTNGKTTTVNVLHTLANAHVGKAFSVSTAMVRIGDESEHNATKMSSLDPSSLQKIFRRAKNAGCQVAIIEVTSHGLDQNRFAGIDFDMAILTNITPDHLEYHGSREAYVAAKKKLFTKAVAHRKGKSYAVFPKDDQVGRRRYEEFLFDEKMTFGLTSQA
jgi:UDP-N-acetylmuramoyl-L-alanyl-D-glutamate--2,6-diaminopimelate ligase